jgi:glycosyltransferase involved in cell wall biosynthesis
MLSADILWLDAVLHLRSASSGKVFEYLRSGKPILAIAHPESPAAELIQRFGAGSLVSREDPEEAGEALLAMAEHPPDRLASEDLAAFTREALAERLSSLLLGVAE